ncbi:Aldehyde dehydrogenase B [Labilithrix luteola]|uniref:aldehyde dehydrogenase (NAD(+)) n=1 Tax=Labilithrix luteola TaxID=1391654 RepID=A0A0K1PLH0_9BACT|nr:aldehyde dehydrogenase family protein [Labilithrix luteola]AKU94231.1 Aldehyde dehydrogenase B [Labilithrix luteola]
MDIAKQLRAVGLDPASFERGDLLVRSPIDGTATARLETHDASAVDKTIARAHQAFLAWRSVPAPRRGELVRLFGEELRAHKDQLAALVTIEAGKIVAEARGEVQEMIDICDFACGLSRQLYGLTIASERPGHRMGETWHPLGVVGVISAFNFPVAVWAWNAALAFVCGDSVVWKPSEKTPLTALACQSLFRRACARFAESGAAAPEGLCEILLGDAKVGERLADDPRVPLLSATGSTRMGRAVAPRVAARFGRSLLELGGNNAMIVTPSADLDLAVRAILFSAVGTAGQRCTTLRRLIAHESVRNDLLARLERAYSQLSSKIGDPRQGSTLIGPLIDGASFEAMQGSLARARSEGGEVAFGERVSVSGCEEGFYARPAIVRMTKQTDVVRHETFAPILYAMSYGDMNEAIAMHNDVPQGLSSCIFTNDLREAERFLSVEGSDCGIANVNIGPSGAEIGGAFGGEKETGGGRESGSDAWRNYMRRATNTVNYGKDLPLAQGIVFG